MNSGVKRLMGWAGIGMAVCLLSGCTSIGPAKIPGDRFGYSHALAESWKSQMLLNIVKVRYMDLPIFLDIGQVVSGYSMETSVNVGGTLSSAGAVQGDFGALGASGKYTDRPTITYMPLTGDRFLEGFLVPIQPEKVFVLVQAGYAADFILELCLDSFNGLHNRPASLASKRQADPEFFKVLSLLRDVQDEGALGMKIVQSDDDTASTVFFFRSDNVSEEILAKAAEVRHLLGIQEQRHQFNLVYSPMRGGTPDELGVGTRSLWQILGAMAMGVVVPEAHRERGLVPPLTEVPDGEAALLRVHSGPSRPADAYVAVPYEGEWFWVANNDWRSKRTFTSILFLFTLANTGDSESLPTITIPAQ